MSERTIDDLIEVIRKAEKSEAGFNMVYSHHTLDLSSTNSRPDHPCGTTCCIGGHAALALAPSWREADVISVTAAVETFGVPRHLSVDLCYPDEDEDRADDPKSPWNALPHHAIRALEIIRDEGVVDWKRAMEAELDATS